VSLEAAGPEYMPRVEALRLGQDDRGYRWIIFAGTMLVLRNCAADDKQRTPAW
jgi:hypothetical protein